MGRDKSSEQGDCGLSAADFRVYNGMAEHMDFFHERFRAQWKLMYNAASTGQRPMGMSIRSFIDVGETFLHHLTMHHSIEERHIFPVLAKKMPAFEDELALKGQHKEIHKGMDKMGEYLSKCKTGEEDLRYDELKRIMDTFGKVLWEHLDEEVKQLGAENMSKFWSKEEMARMPF